MGEVFSEKEKDKLIEYVMKQNEFENTALVVAASKGDEETVKLLLNVFKDEKDKLIEYVMKQNKNNETALFLATAYRNERIVKLLLEVFSEKEKDKLIEYVMKQHSKITVLHLASSNRLEETVHLLLNVFGKDENVQLVAYLMKTNQDNNTALFLASTSPRVNLGIVKFLTQKLTNAKNEIILSTLHLLTQKFKMKNTVDKKKSILWSLLDDHSRCLPAKEVIKKFLIIDYITELK